MRSGGYKYVGIAFAGLVFVGRHVPDNSIIISILDNKDHSILVKSFMSRSIHVWSVFDALKIYK